MVKKRSQRTCIYCGASERLSDDHVPPKNLFPKPRPANLITVPSCEECNRGFSKDDEYFRLMVAIREDIADSSQAHKLLPAIHRSLGRSRGKGLLHGLLNSSEEVELVTQSGIFLGTSAKYKPEFERLNRVVERTVKGLLYRHFDAPLPSGYSVRVFNEDGLEATEGAFVDAARQMAAKVVRNPCQSIGDGVFQYWYAKVASKDFCSMWVMTFYERASWLCFVSESPLNNDQAGQ
ncbi:HNH endonuclease [Aeoliella sp.]|uniref:HNH endonuclease n=1 Tax=Aeoliella sp. TaxID=2795800 RepID=UPI003CCC0B19